jgi:hypothetical protein
MNPEDRGTIEEEELPAIWIPGGSLHITLANTAITWYKNRDSMAKWDGLSFMIGDSRHPGRKGDI